MIRHATFTVEEIFELMDSRSKILPTGHRFRPTSGRLVLFRTKGPACVTCDLVGTFFALESVGDETPHLNLYGFDGSGGEILMTKDHIHPKSKGGANEQANYQPMCATCNSKKADKV